MAPGRPARQRPQAALWLVQNKCATTLGRWQGRWWLECAAASPRVPAIVQGASPEALLSDRGTIIMSSPFPRRVAPAGGADSARRWVVWLAPLAQRGALLSAHDKPAAGARASAASGAATALAAAGAPHMGRRAAGRSRQAAIGGTAGGLPARGNNAAAAARGVGKRPAAPPRKQQQQVPTPTPLAAALRQLPGGAGALIGWRVVLPAARSRAGFDVGTVQEVGAPAATAASSCQPILTAAPAACCKLVISPPQATRLAAAVTLLSY